MCIQNSQHLDVYGNKPCIVNFAILACVNMIATFTKDQVLHKQRMPWRSHVVEEDTGEGGIGPRFGRLTRLRQDNGRRRRRRRQQWVSAS